MKTEDNLREMKEMLVAASKKIYNAALVLPGEGNLSLRIPGEETMLITPTMNRYDDLSSDDIACVGFDGTVDSRRGGTRLPSSEFRIHAAVFRQRPRAMAVVHAHPPQAVSFAAAGIGIPVIIEEMAIVLGGEIPCAPYRRTGTDSLAETVVSSLGSGNAVLLANHGFLSCGRTLVDAVDTLFVVEKLAGVYQRALLIGGGTVPPVPSADRPVLASVFRERFSTN